MKNKLIFLNIWSSYATHYFGKVNLSIVVPALLATQKDLSMMNVAAVYYFHFRFNNAL
jgi:sugar phosphate permease